jgi:cytochrome oxidase assembly protein ShyY1
MYRFLLRPKWLAFHVLIIFLVVVMVNLGFWQLHRLQGRRAFNDEVRSRTAQATAPYGEVVTDGVDPDAVAWRTVIVSGTYLGDEQVVVLNRSQAGSAGVDVVTPLELPSGSLVLINRGFVSETEPVPAPPTGPVTILGRLQVSEARRLGGLTDPGGDLTEIQRLDIDRLSAQLPAPVAPVFVNLLQSKPTQGSSPVPVADPELDEGPHMSYMIQWWIFSITAIVGWVLAVRRSARQRLSAATATVEQPAEQPPDQTPLQIEPDAADSPSPAVDASATTRS